VKPHNDVIGDIGMNTTPRIYVADLAAYNSGRLVGQWIDLEDGSDLDHDEFVLWLAAVIDSEILLPGHEEWAIHDYEGFGPITVGEYDSLDTIASHVERMGDDPAKFFAYIDAMGTYCADQYDPDTVDGPYASEEAYADEWLENTIGTVDVVEWARENGMPEALTYGLRFDTEAFIYALRCNTAITFGTYDGAVYAVEG
jgi:antirestriction protein